MKQTNEPTRTTVLGRVGRPKRRERLYDRRKVPIDYQIPQAWHAWVSGVKPHAP